MRSIPFLVWDGCRITLGVCELVIPSGVPDGVRAVVPPAMAANRGPAQPGPEVRADGEPGSHASASLTKGGTRKGVFLCGLLLSRGK
jgi:hypothetical protein